MKTAFSRILLPICFVLFSILFFSHSLCAQDSIVLLNNSVILAKVEEIDVNDIKYHRADNISGPLYDLPKAQIYEIVYINGTVDVMNPQQGNLGSGLQNNAGQQDNTVAPTTNGQPVNESQPNTSLQDNSSIQYNQGQSTPQYNQGQQSQQDYSNQQTQQPNNGQPDNVLAPNTQYQVPPQQPQQAPVTMQTFYDQLSPYGNWVNSPAYGYVWVPNVGMDFTPYGTAGHWAFTDYGWTWVSDFPWGWAAFHYGRWYYDPYLGYVWTPTTVWGPAWVTWRSNDGYYGWAPMGPAGYEYPRDRWVFVNAGYITNERIYDHYEPRQNVTYIYSNTTVIENNYVERGGVRYVAGPDRVEVERVTHTAIAPVRVVSTSNPGQTMHANGQITMYHPAMQAENIATPSRPAQIVRAEDVTPPAQRTTVIHPTVNNLHSEHYEQENNNRRLPTEPQQRSVPATENNQAREQRTEPEQQNNNIHTTQQRTQPQPRPAAQQQPKQPKPAPRPSNPKPATPQKKN